MRGSALIKVQQAFPKGLSEALAWLRGRFRDIGGSMLYSTNKLRLPYDWPTLAYLTLRLAIGICTLHMYPKVPKRV